MLKQNNYVWIQARPTSPLALIRIAFLILTISPIYSFYCSSLYQSYTVSMALLFIYAFILSNNNGQFDINTQGHLASKPEAGFLRNVGWMVDRELGSVREIDYFPLLVSRQCLSFIAALCLHQCTTQGRICVPNGTHSLYSELLLTRALVKSSTLYMD